MILFPWYQPWKRLTKGSKGSKASIQDELGEVSCCRYQWYRWCYVLGTAWRAADLRWIPICPVGLCSGLSLISHFSIATQVVTLPGTWPCRVTAWTSWPGVSILWLGEMENLICKCPWFTLVCVWDVKNQQTTTTLLPWSIRRSDVLYWTSYSLLLEMASQDWLSVVEAYQGSTVLNGVVL